ncbi:MAG: DUF935 domain-containing protein [Betaproteobacteria bacterium]|nr:DUF935 domain-containing protein [Betaproteobacteria bacterium]MCL2886534.1 DUF935 domain-containing protein [Betaproteobacteria bacterium]
MARVTRKSVGTGLVPARRGEKFFAPTTPRRPVGANNHSPLSHELTSEAAPRRLDPWEQDYLGIIRPNDPFLRERGADLDLYLDLIKDGKVRFCLQKRVGVLVSSPWSVAPVDAGDSESAERLTALLGKFAFDRLWADLAETVLLAGFGVVEIVWDIVDGIVIPRSLPVRRQSRFVFKDIEGGAPELRLLVESNMVEGIPLPDKKFIVHRIHPRDDNPYGTGLGLQLYWPVFFKRKATAAWAKFADRFGTPTPWGRYPTDAKQPEKNTLADALRAFSHDGFVMTPEGVLIDLIEANGSAATNVHETLRRAMNDEIAAVLLCQDERGESGGALAAASKERVSGLLTQVQSDADLISETLNRTLIKWLCEFNGINPCTVYRPIKEEDDLKAMAETDAIIAGMGFTLAEEAVRAKYGEGWSVAEKPPATDPTSPSPLAGEGRGEGEVEASAFAEGESTRPNAAVGANNYSPPDPAQAEIDRALAAIPDAALDAAMQPIIEALTAAIDASDSYEEALAKATAALPDIPLDKLADLLLNAMFGAETFGRLTQESRGE